MGPILVDPSYHFQFVQDVPNPLDLNPAHTDKLMSKWQCQRRTAYFPVRRTVLHKVRTLCNTAITKKQILKSGRSDWLKIRLLF